MKTATERYLEVCTATQELTNSILTDSNFLIIDKLIEHACNRGDMFITIPVGSLDNFPFKEELEGLGYELTVYLNNTTISWYRIK